jgi:hypothetical protein
MVFAGNLRFFPSNLEAIRLQGFSYVRGRPDAGRRERRAKSNRGLKALAAA